MSIDSARPVQLTADTCDRNVWDAFVRDHPAGHLFQSHDWGELQIGLGARPHRIAARDDGGRLLGVMQLLVFDTGNRVFAYVPRGPVCDPDDEGLVELLTDAAVAISQAAGAEFIRIEPQWTFDAELAVRLESRGWVRTTQSIMLPRTILVALDPDLDTVWSGFRSNTRNRIRLAEKLGVHVRAGGDADLPTFIRLAEETAARHGLRRDSRQYELAWRHFGSTGNLFFALASAEGRDLAAMMVFACGANATYVWGASAGSPEARRFNPNQLLHWTAMRWAHAHGCRTYDFHGIPDHDEHVLEAEYSRHDDGTWKLYRFKRGFGGRVHRHLGTYDWMCGAGST
jgi:lipid II:glycine glycyltransferase (peptidoglycan interpeptide bridge formation enzyme)